MLYKPKYLRVKINSWLINLWPLIYRDMSKFFLMVSKAFHDLGSAFFSSSLPTSPCFGLRLQLLNSFWFNKHTYWFSQYAYWLSLCCPRSFLMLHLKLAMNLPPITLVFVLWWLIYYFHQKIVPELSPQHNNTAQCVHPLHSYNIMYIYLIVLQVLVLIGTVVPIRISANVELKLNSSFLFKCDHWSPPSWSSLCF